MSDEPKEDQPLKQHEQKQRSLIVSICQLLLEGGILSIASFFATLPILVIVIFAGQLSILNLDVISLVIAGYMFIGSTMTFGALYSLQPQISSELASGDIARVPAVFQRGVFAISLLYLLLAIPILLLSPFVFSALQQNQQVSFAAGYCLMGSIPSLFAFLLHEMLAQIYIAQKCGVFIVASTFTMFILSLIFNFILIVWLKLGLIGIIITLNISYFSGLFVLVGITLINKSQRELNLFIYTPDSSQDFWSVLKTIAMGLLMGLAGNFFTELGTILAGILGPIELAAQAILTRYSFLLVQIMVGFLKTNVARLSKAYAILDKELYFHELRVAIIFNIFIAILYCVLNIVTRYPLANMVTDETTVVQLTASITPLVALSNMLAVGWATFTIIFCSTQNVAIPSIISAIMNIGVGSPLAIVLSLYTTLRLAGVYWALATLQSLEVAALLVALLIKWNSIFHSLSVSSTAYSTE